MSPERLGLAFLSPPDKTKAKTKAKRHVRRASRVFSRHRTAPAASPPLQEIPHFYILRDGDGAVLSQWRQACVHNPRLDPSAVSLSVRLRLLPEGSAQGPGVLPSASARSRPSASSLRAPTKGGESSSQGNGRKVQQQPRNRLYPSRSAQEGGGEGGGAEEGKTDEARKGGLQRPPMEAAGQLLEDQSSCPAGQNEGREGAELPVEEEEPEESGSCGGAGLVKLPISPPGPYEAPSARAVFLLLISPLLPSPFSLHIEVPTPS